MDNAIIKEMGNKLPKTYRTLIFAPCRGCLIDYFTEYIDGHFVLYSFNPGRGEKNLFGVEDEDKAEEADRRLYESALKYISNCNVEDQTRYSNIKVKLG